MARMAAPFLKVPMLPVRDNVPSGKMTTDQRWARCSFNRSNAGRAPPARGIGNVLINSWVRTASHLRLKIESAAATTKARKRKDQEGLQHGAGAADRSALGPGGNRHGRRACGSQFSPPPAGRPAKVG